MDASLPCFVERRNMIRGTGAFLLKKRNKCIWVEEAWSSSRTTKHHAALKNSVRGMVEVFRSEGPGIE